MRRHIIVAPVVFAVPFCVVLLYFFNLLLSTAGPSDNEIQRDIEDKACQPSKPKPKIFACKLRGKVLVPYPTPVWIGLVPSTSSTRDIDDKDDYVSPYQ
jgi:hypothetical protein